MSRRSLAASLAALALTAVTPRTPAQSRPASPPAADPADYMPDVMTSALRNVPAIRACYERAARGAGGEAWRAVQSVALVVAADGRVRDFRVDPAGAGTARFRGCMLPIVRGWRLHAPPGGAAVMISYAAADLRRAVEQYASR